MLRRRAARAAFAAALLAAAIAACGGSGSISPPPSPTATPPIPTEVPGGRTPAAGPGTFTTAWGPAWDALPPGFPLPPDSRPADPGDPATGPVSATFAIGRPPEEVAADVQAALARAGYSTEGVSGPYEDGSVVVDSVWRDPACRVQTAIRPRGGIVMITVLYGAACPWE